MPEQEVKNRRLTLFIFIVFSLLVLILAGQSFSSTEIKKSEEPAFSYVPIYKQGSSELEISALSYLGAYLGEDSQPIILAEKNSEDLLPMASLTKLMTAIVAYKNYNLEDEITMDLKVNDWTDSSKKFIPGTSFKIKELLRALLVESNNDAAMALAGKMGMDNFISAMNKEAQKLGIIITYYDNPVGIDPASEKEIINYSTAKELLVLAREIINNYPEIMEITSLSQYEIRTSSGIYNHTALNTNKFLTDENEKLSCQGDPLKIFGGKTGFTDLSKKNLLLVTESPNGVGKIITIVLSADDNFLEIKKLVNWICDSYDWPVSIKTATDNLKSVEN